MWPLVQKVPGRSDVGPMVLQLGQIVWDLLCFRNDDSADPLNSEKLMCFRFLYSFVLRAVGRDHTVQLVQRRGSNRHMVRRAAHKVLRDHCTVGTTSAAVQCKSPFSHQHHQRKSFAELANKLAEAFVI